MQDELTIRIAGEAGQGMQTIGAALCKVFKNARFHLFANQDYMSRIRGGNNFFQIRIGDRPLYTLRESEHLSWLILEGIKHKGFSLIDVLQPCVSFNKKNTHEWYSKRIYKLDDDKSYDPTNKSMAVEKACEWGDRIPISIIYKLEKKSYEERCGLSDMPPLVDEGVEDIDIREILKGYA